MNQEPDFHFFTNYDATIYIKDIDQVINYGAKTIKLKFYFSMIFDNQRYTFVGYSDRLNDVPFDKINDIQQILLNKERKVRLLGMRHNPFLGIRYNYDISIDLKLTDDEITFLI